jgi:DNA-binding NtrC family response regulator
VARGGDEPPLLDLLETWDVPQELVDRFVGDSRDAQLVRQLILRAARTSEPVLILGATGTGKEVVARSIHEYGPRRAERFTPVNCGAIPGDLLESELFGHERGAFTTAVRKKIGLWKVAGRGTLFLDEIADLGPGHQAKLLRTLQEGVVRPLGSTEEIAVHARVIAATNRDLYGMVREGEFREDLYYRLRSFMIETPNLQAHREDIPALAQFFWRQITDRPSASLSGPILSELEGRSWPGNARELRAVLANLHALFGADGLDSGRLTAVLQVHGYDAPGKRAREVRQDVDRLRERAHRLRIEDVVRACRVTLQPLGKRAGGDDHVDRIREALRRRLEEMRLVVYRETSAEADSRPLPDSILAELDQLRRGLVDLEAELEVDPAEGRRHWRRDLKEQIDRTLRAVEGEVAALDQG